MLSLKKLRFCNIGRFVKPQEIDFTVFDRILQVNGVNRNTGGSSGAAKTTIFHAQDYLLGVNDISATNLQSRLTKELIWVEGVYDVDGVELIIKRSKKDGLTVKFGDEVVSGNVKLAEERLSEIIGIPSKLFKKMIHKKQKESGFFLNFTAKESYDFLMNALELEEFKEKTVRIDEDIKKITSEINVLGTNIENVKSSIIEIQELKNFEKTPECDVSLDKLSIMKDKYQELCSEIKELELKRDSEISVLSESKPIAPSLTDNTNDTHTLEKERLSLEEDRKKIILEKIQKKSKISEVLDKLKQDLSLIPHAKKNIERCVVEIKKLSLEKEHLLESKCPTCMQNWSGEEVSNKIANIDIKIQESKDHISSNKSTIESESSIRYKIDRLNNIIKNIEDDDLSSSIDNKISSLKEKIISIKANHQSQLRKIENEYLKNLNNYNEKIQSIRDSYSAFISKKTSSANELYTRIKSNSVKLDNYNKNIELYEQKMTKYTQTLEEKKGLLKDFINRRDELSYKLQVAEESKRLIKTYTLQIFQETLDSIGNYATDILSNIPNMSNSTIYFEGCKENKSGSIKDEVNAIINMDGHNDINIKTLSGGERTVIDLAVDLAVIDMIESRTGKGADFFILDEPFDGLEDINIAQCLEMLKQADTNKKIIIVDHNPIAKEMISDSIVIERNGEESMVL